MQKELEIGKFNDLRVERDTAIGLYLGYPGGEILLPGRYVPKGLSHGDILSVFVYRDSEDRLIATTQKPFAVAGEFAYLKVVAITRAGVFLDWGIQKDLLVPYSEQSGKMEVGRKYVVRIFIDQRTQRIAATAKIGRFMEKENIGLREGESVSLMIYRLTDYGIKVIINNRYFGLLYKGEVFRDLNVGDRAEGHVSRIRPDGKVDVRLGKAGPESIEDAKAAILKTLREHRGFLPLGDDSSPQDIRDALNISKKSFKKAIGGLYKDELIEIQKDGIKLNRNKAKMLHLFKF